MTRSQRNKAPIHTLISFFLLILYIPLFSNGDPKVSVTGNVTAEGKPVPYISVMVKGTTIGTVTDDKGQYALQLVPSGEVVIRIQGMGYETKEKAIITKEGGAFDFELKTDVLLLDQVVVTSDRNEVNRKKASVIVNVLSPKVFEANQSISMMDGLDFSPGVRTETNCQNCGFTQVRMNGLEGPYSQILINSRQVFSGLAGVYGLELIPANMIQRVEVVRGGGSALYGGNAIAGTINVITKEPTYNSFQAGFDGFAIGAGNNEGGPTAYETNLTFNGSLVSDNFKSGVSVFGQYRNRDPYDFNGDGFSEMVMIDNISGGLNAFYKPGKLSKISLDLYAINEDRRGGNDFNLLPHESDITEFASHKIYGASLNYDLFTLDHSKFSAYGAGQFVDRETYYGALQDPNGYGETEDLSTNIGVQYTHDFEKLWFAHADLTVGTEYTGGWLKDTKLGAPGETNSEIADQNINTFGTYVQADWKANRYKLVLGLRYDHYSVMDNHNEGEDLVGNVIIPRASFMYSFTPDLQFRLSYAKGYRAPQIFDEDLHIESSGARQVLHTNDPDLKQETSHSFSTSLNYSKATPKYVIELLGEGFYTRLLDPFANEYNPLDTNGTVEYVRVNAEGGAQVYGVNFEATIATMKALDFQLGMTFQRSLYDEELPWGEEEGNTTRNFVRTPNNYGYLTANWKPLKGFMASLTGTYTGSMLVPHFGLDAQTTDPDERAAIEKGDVITGEKLNRSNPFFDLGLRLAYSFPISKKISLEVHGGVKNIFNSIQTDLDSGVYRDPGYIYGPNYARTVYFGLKVGNLF